MKGERLQVTVAILFLSSCVAGKSIIPDIRQMPEPRYNSSLPKDALRSPTLEPRQHEMQYECDRIEPTGTFDIQLGETVCITSRNYPNNYPADSFDSWIVNIPFDATKLNIECSIDIASDLECFTDKLIFYDGCSIKSSCEGDFDLGVIEPCSSQVFFLFTSDEEIESKGFYCSITALDPEEPDCKCGMPNRQNRIIGGEMTEVNEYPWLVALGRTYMDNDAYCGGSVYNSEWVITAAHCIGETTEQDTTILFNMWDQLYGPTIIVRRAIKEIIVHPRYNETSVQNDIALIQLEEPVSLTSYEGIRPICLPSPETNYFGKDGIVTGWGRLAEDGSKSEIAMEVTVPIVTREQCSEFNPNNIMDGMLCAGIAEGGKDSCQGDSGGPLTVEEASGQHTLVGVVSWGIGCGRPNRYGVYAKVQDYLDFIQQNVKSGISCHK